MNAHVVGVKPHLEAASPAEKAQPKKAASPFDHALSQMAPRKGNPDTKAQTQSQPKKKPDDDAVRDARLFAAMNGAQFAPLLDKTSAPRPGGAVALPEPLGQEAIALPFVVAPANREIAGVNQDEIPTKPDHEPTVGNIDDAATDADIELPEGMESADDQRFSLDRAKSEVTSQDSAPQQDAQPTIDPAQVEALIASAQPVQEHKETMKTSPTDEHHTAAISPFAMESQKATNVAEPRIAVEKTAAPQPVEWHGLAEKIANGSMEGNRARIVIGQGDDRVVLTVSTHAHKVAIEVETSSQAGQQLAEQLKSSELRDALQKHGLDLADGSQQRHRDTEPEDAPLQLAPKKQMTPTITRPTGLVA